MVQISIGDLTDNCLAWEHNSNDDDGGEVFNDENVECLALHGIADQNTGKKADSCFV